MKKIRDYPLQITGAILGCAYLVYGVLQSTNSTAVIGYLFLPFAAGLGAFIGDAAQYGMDLMRGRRRHSWLKTALIALAICFSAYHFVDAHLRKRDLRISADPNAPSERLERLLKKRDQEITRTVLLNPALKQEIFERLIDEKIMDDYTMHEIVMSPRVPSGFLERVAKLERNQFRGDAEYRLYQTFVWARLAKREDVPESIIRRLVAKPELSHFLILALLDSKYVTCEEKKRFLPQPNEVLANHIERSMQAQGCAK